MRLRRNDVSCHVVRRGWCAGRCRFRISFCFLLLLSLTVRFGSICGLCLCLSLRVFFSFARSWYHPSLNLRSLLAIELSVQSASASGLLDGTYMSLLYHEFVVLGTFVHCVLISISRRLWSFLFTPYNCLWAIESEAICSRRTSSAHRMPVHLVSTVHPILSFHLSSQLPHPPLPNPSHLFPPNRRSWTSLNARLPLRNAITPSTPRTGSV